MKKRTRQLLRAARALDMAATTETGGLGDPWTVPEEEILGLNEALEAFQEEL